MPTITTNDGVRIDYEDVGTGRPLVMIPGWSCSHRFFKKNVPVLARSFRVITPNMRAHGDSEKSAWGHRISRYAKDVRDLVETLQLENVTLLGWSMGSAVAWSYLDLFGNDRLAGHISVDQSPRQYYNETWRWGQPGCYDAEALAIFTVRLEYDAAGVIRGLLPACFGEVYRPTPEEIEEFAGEIEKCPPRVQAEIMADHTHLDWRDLLPRITLPALVCVGRQSKIFPWQGSAYVGESIPGARTVFFEESGHMPFYEEPEKFNSVVRDFVLGLP
jgi:pimeloyl-ACP methyl ester carboxylesterase